MPNKPLPTIAATDFLPNGCSIGATHIGNRREALQMLEVAAKNGIRSWVQEEQMSSEGCTRALEAVKKGNVRYRWVFNAQNAFGTRDEAMPTVNGTHVNGTSSMTNGS